MSELFGLPRLIYGGLIRSIRVARMAELRDMVTTLHLSGGFGFVYSLHFASCTPRIGPWQEYKKGVETYGQWLNPPLRIVDGAISVPKGPGVGIADPKEVLKDATPFRMPLLLPRPRVLQVKGNPRGC